MLSPQKWVNRYSDTCVSFSSQNPVSALQTGSLGLNFPIVGSVSLNKGSWNTGQTLNWFQLKRGSGWHHHDILGGDLAPWHRTNCLVENRFRGKKQQASLNHDVWSLVWGGGVILKRSNHDSDDTALRVWSDRDFLVSWQSKPMVYHSGKETPQQEKQANILSTMISQEAWCFRVVDMDGCVFVKKEREKNETVRMK